MTFFPSKFLNKSLKMTPIHICMYFSVYFADLACLKLLGWHWLSSLPSEGLGAVAVAAPSMGKVQAYARGESQWNYDSGWIFQRSKSVHYHFICMKHWQASLWEENALLSEIQFCVEAMGWIFSNILNASYKTTKLSTVNRKGAFWMHQLVYEHIWEADIRKGQIGSSRSMLQTLRWTPVSP